MIHTTVDKGYLNRYLHKLQELEHKKRLKYEILDSCGLKACDIPKIKVTPQNNKPTKQEQAILRIEKINNRIQELTALIEPIQKDLNVQIDEVDTNSSDSRHAEILRMLYLEGFSVKDVILSLYPEDNKAARSSVEGLRKTAEKMLAKTKGRPFVIVEKIKAKEFKEKK